jgi:anti-sigma-K factor RskA
MDIQKYISSGVLELYVCGALPEGEGREVSKELKKHPEIKKEVEEIEAALSQLSSAAAPYNPNEVLKSIQDKIGNKKVHRLPQEKRSRNNWVVYIGWAASIALLIGLFSLIKDNNDLRKDLNQSNAKKVVLEEEVNEAESKAEDAEGNKQEAEKMLAAIRNENTVKVKLKGQEKVAPNSYAAAFFNPEENKLIIDAKGLPEPPEGKVYQVWSLTFDPLKPTSVGLLDRFDQNEKKLFQLANANSSQGFGITLEPTGGSKTPTMSQLYTLGKVTG